MPFISLVIALLAVPGVQGFTPSTHSTPAFLRQYVAKGETSSQLHELITAESADFTYDDGQGGVRLARESAIKLAGSIKHGPGKANVEVEKLIRYKKVTEVEDSVVKSVMNKAGASIVTTGKGQEHYKDPGETTIKEIDFAPDQAVRDALMGAASVDESSNIVVNFLGGDDLITDQVIDAMSKLVLDMSPPTKVKVTFNSMCHSSFPLESATVTVVSTRAKSGDDEEEGRLSGAEKSVATGEVYFRDGKWFTVVADDINPAIA